MQWCSGRLPRAFLLPRQLPMMGNFSVVPHGELFNGSVYDHICPTNGEKVMMRDMSDRRKTKEMLSNINLGTPFTPQAKMVSLGVDAGFGIPNVAYIGGILSSKKPSLAEVITFGGIPATTANEIRSSDRVIA
jgi:hypothetical protein